MKKFLKTNKSDILTILTFIFTFIIIYLILTKNNHLFASIIDFKYQHYLIPEYFRTLFYNTHDLFPDFALNLGGGQNIYYLSYYGLLNPIILISYLFPKIKMIDYIIISSCLIILSSTTMFYFYLRKNNYSNKISFIVAFLFLMSGPLIFHAKRHIMFINYFPFLILALYGIDNYINNKKGTLLTISIALIILTSYYFSISALIILFIYFIYKYINKKKKITFKNLISMTIPFILGVMISAILILPTAYTLLNGRNSTTTTISLSELLTPSITKTLFYSPYSIGLTLISLISLIYCALKHKKETKALTITCLLFITFPIFNYILNGTLYINAKSLIPFSPIILILVAEFLTNYFKNKTTTKQNILIIYLILSSFTICLYTNTKDKLMSKVDITNTKYKTTLELINKITKEDKDFYRISNTVSNKDTINQITNINEYKTTMYSSTYNNNYTKLYNDILNNPIASRNKFMITPSNNILSNYLLNEKYIITTDKLGLDLELIDTKNDINVYKNNNVLPLGYASNHLVSTNEFNKLTYPENAITLLNNIVINDNIKTTNHQPITKKEKINYQILETNNLKIDKQQNKTIINANKKSSMKIKVNEDTKNKIIFIRFKVKESNQQDLSITINNITNTLTNKTWKYFNNNTTFDYCIYDTNTLNIEFKKGKYELNNFELYELDYNKIKNINKTIDKFKINKIKTKGDNIEGTINVTKNNSYFTISIPYDKGFNILVDNKKVPYEKTGANFIASKITKGNHNIKITYAAPLKNIASIISSLGIILLIIYSYTQNHPININKLKQRKKSK